jgi:hypothetical protein
VWWPLGAYWAYLRFLRSPRPAWALAAGAAWGLCFYVCMYQSIHLTLLLGFDAGWRLWHGRSMAFCARERWPVLVFTIALAALTALLSWEAQLSSYGLLLLGAGGAAALARDGWRRLRSTALPRGAALAALAGLALLVPFFATQALDPRLSGATPRMALSEKVYWSAQPLSYLLSPHIVRALVEQGHLGGTDLMHLDADGEFSNFPGYAFWGLLLAVGALAWRKAREQRKWLALAGAFALLSLGPVLRWGPEVKVGWLPGHMIFLPGAVWHFLPLLDGYRAYTRLGFWVFFCLAVFVGLAWPAAWGRLGRVRRPLWQWLAVAAVGALVLTERLSLPAPALEVRVPAFYERLANAAPRSEPLVLVEFPGRFGQYLVPLTRHGQRVTNYYLSRSDPGQERREGKNGFLFLLSDYEASYEASLSGMRHEEAQPVPRAQLQADFARLGVDGVVMHRRYLPARHAEWFDALFREVLGMAVAYRDEEVVFYRNPRGQAFALPQAEEMK